MCDVLAFTGNVGSVRCLSIYWKCWKCAMSLLFPLEVAVGHDSGKEQLNFNTKLIMACHSTCVFSPLNAVR